MASDRFDELIAGHVGAAMAAAAVPLAGVDVAAVTAVQIDLVRRLARRHGLPYDGERGRAAVAALAGASLARFGASAIKLVPGAGTLAGGAAQVLLAGASTYAIGEVYREHFARRGSLAAESDADTLRARYREALERGRDVARRLRRQSRAAETARSDEERQRERLELLRRTGVLTQAEYERLIELHEEERAAADEGASRV